jgi:hypothetical protein
MLAEEAHLTEKQWLLEEQFNTEKLRLFPEVPRMTTGMQ